MRIRPVGERWLMEWLGTGRGLLAYFSEQS